MENRKIKKTKEKEEKGKVEYERAKKIQKGQKRVCEGDYLRTGIAGGEINIIFDVKGGLVVLGPIYRPLPELRSTLHYTSIKYNTSCIKWYGTCVSVSYRTVF